MTTSSLSKRLRTIELRNGKANRRTTAFVIRAQTSEVAQAMLARALKSQAVKSGDPVLIITCLSFASAEWDDISNLTLDDIGKLAEGDGGPRYDAHSAAIRTMTDNELHAVIVDSLPRVA